IGYTLPDRCHGLTKPRFSPCLKGVLVGAPYLTREGSGATGEPKRSLTPVRCSNATHAPSRAGRCRRWADHWPRVAAKTARLDIRPLACDRSLRWRMSAAADMLPTGEGMAGAGSLPAATRTHRSHADALFTVGTSDRHAGVQSRV